MIRRFARRLLTPSPLDFISTAVLAWLFLFSPKGWGLLLSDGDTGWHIRTGEWILAHRQVPYTDFFSYTRPGQPWFAWEWGADVVFALLHQAGGLPLLTFFTGFLLVLIAVLTLRWMLWRGAHIWVAFPVFLLTVGGSTMHYLARPHIFTLVFLLATLWLLDAERRLPSHRVWFLVPLTLLWTNLHGGWPVVFVFLGLQIACRVLFHDPRWRTELLVALACAAATLVNPYGWHLHQHIFAYLDSSWIQQAVDEFQSPQFRAENLLHFEALLIAGIATAATRASRGMAGLSEALAVWLWAHMSLGAVRHAPLFLLTAAPVVASELSLLLEKSWAGARKSSLPGIFREINSDLRPLFAKISAGLFLFPFLLWLAYPSRQPSDFPEKLFPVAALRSAGHHLAGQRVFASDQWGDYLLYKLWPANTVFIDGRSDFYGPELGKTYLAIANASHSFSSELERYGVNFLLLPRASDLAARASLDPDWQVIYSDEVSVILRRLQPRANSTTPAHLFSPPRLMKAPLSTEGLR
ncbi:MAG: hypothetical protein ACK5ZJ_23715 [Acidobacteriota bacterium]